VQSPEKGIGGKEDPVEKNKIYLNRKWLEKDSKIFS